MKLKTNELRKFNAVTSSMKQNGIIPVLSYLRFKDGVITKNNLEQFVEMEADFEGECLIDERVLMAFVNSVSGDVIDVKIDEKSVTMVCGKRVTKSPTEAVENYPLVEDNNLEGIAIDEGIIKSIKIASNFTMERENLPYTSCVFLGRGILGAATGFIGYVEKIDESIPEMILDRNAISVIKGLNNFNFSQNESFQFIRSGVFNFGFRKTDTKFVNYAPFAEVTITNGVEVDKHEIISFCDYCVGSTPSKVVIAKVSGNKLSMEDADYGISAEQELSVELEDFNFNPSFMGKLLKSVPNDTVTFLRAKQKYFITGESGFVSLIMEMQ
jgi:hypothetical protein